MAQRTSMLRIRLSAGSRKAQSRTPYGCSIGSWTTSATLPAGGCRTIDVPRWLGADGDPLHPAVFHVVADLEAERVAIEGQGGVQVGMREEALMNRDVHGRHVSCGSVTALLDF
jgi:hypothetical protein